MYGQCLLAGKHVQNIVMFAYVYVLIAHIPLKVTLRKGLCICKTETRLCACNCKAVL